jgi:hypothetical protein
MLNNTLKAGAVGAGAATRYGSGSDQMMRLLAVPAPQHCWTQAASIDFAHIVADGKNIINPDLIITVHEKFARAILLIVMNAICSHEKVFEILYLNPRFVSNCMRYANIFFYF